MAKDEREVGLVTFRAVVVPVRSGKGGAKSIRYHDFEKAMSLAKSGGSRIVFDVPGEKEPVDPGLYMQADEPEQMPLFGSDNGKGKVEKSDAGIPESE